MNLHINNANNSIHIDNDRVEPIEADLSMFWFYYWRTHRLFTNGTLIPSDVLILADMCSQPKMTSFYNAASLRDMMERTGLSLSMLHKRKVELLKLGFIVKQGRGDFTLSEKVTDFQTKINTLYKTKKLDCVEIKIKMKMI